VAGHLTPYPEINAVLQDLLTRVQTLLGSDFVGLYLYGSLASGEFDPQRSDIDFLVVTTGELPTEILPTLAAMHKGLAATGSLWAKRLEGSYIPQQALRRYDPAQARHPSLRVDGSFDVDHHGPNWLIQMHLIRQQAITLAGPEPNTLIDPVTPDELMGASLAALREWWEPMLDDPARLRQREYQAYAVLTMCRALYTLQHGTVVSKRVAACWAREFLGQQWVELIDAALAWPSGPQPDRLTETLALIQYTLHLAHAHRS
jgi:predicted nucleotidyltransferase